MLGAMTPDDHHAHDGGLRADLPRLLGRRRAITLLAGVALATACAPGRGEGGGPGGAVEPGSPGEIPQETAGPIPGDGTNGPNVLREAGVVRRDIRPSFGSLSGVAEGVPLTLDLTVTSAATGAAIPGAAVYVWHCDRSGAYSLYDREDQNYLRGVQPADAAGRVVFTSIFPAAYAGRWPHVHFEVYPDLARATGGDAAITTSQLAFPEAVCRQVYALPGYEDSVGNLADVSLASDGVFADGAGAQTAAMSGDPARGLVAALTVPVA
ncbi:dioxygenase-like protein [Actinomycetospora cinnamomea]|uniref:Dioxygenase-like protein n=2 Tax=Actinomycetospora cinnamomea TaxID=663609 RepID=A0A2U1E991_9PSEU|nr:dioxygenase-like protein [Actinomycetospora cinnamomea]